MTVRELAKRGGFEPVTLPDPEREITGVYIGDLLSWVMGRAQSGNVWITIMSNVNIVAVASLADTACILLTENVELAQDVITTAAQKDINILRSKAGIYDTALAISRLL